jgi:hypothetical protein
MTGYENVLLYSGDGGVLRYENQKNLLAGDIYDRISSRSKLPCSNVVTNIDNTQRSVTNTSYVWENNLSITINALEGDLILAFSEGYFWVDGTTRLIVRINAYSGSVNLIYNTNTGVRKTANDIKSFQVGIFKVISNGEITLKHQWFITNPATGYCSERSMIAITIGQVI